MLIKKMIVALGLIGMTAMPLAIDTGVAHAQYKGAEAGLRQGASQDTSFAKILERIIKVLLSIIAGLAIIAIIVAGIMYITAGGDNDRVDSAKGWLTNAVIGLVVALLGWAIVSAVSSALDAG